MRPDGAQAQIDGSWYKIGAHGRVFFHTNLDWVLSSRPVADIKKAVEMVKPAGRGGNKVLKFVTKHWFDMGILLEEGWITGDGRFTKGGLHYKDNEYYDTLPEAIADVKRRKCKKLGTYNTQLRKLGGTGSREKRKVLDVKIKDVISIDVERVT